jgi:hypothetical protein
MRDPLAHQPKEDKMTAKKIPAKNPIVKKQAPPVDDGMVALVRHMAKEHRFTKGEVQAKMFLKNNEHFDRLWSEAGLK